MIISEKRHTEIYKAISDPIMDLRVKNTNGVSTEDMDAELYSLECEIYQRVKAALNLHKE